MRVRFADSLVDDDYLTVWRLEFLPAFFEDPTPLRAELITEDTYDVRDCKRYPEHVTQIFHQRIVVDTYGTDTRGVISVMYSGAFLIEQALAAELQRYSLTGFRLVDKVTIACNQSKHPKLSLLLFEITCQAGNGLRSLVIDNGNSCPNCGHGPLLCESCGHVDCKCPKCGKDDAVVYDDIRIENLVVFEEDWDGTDFFEVSGHWGGYFVSAAARDVINKLGLFGLSLHPAPFRRCR
jgi:hypothetical protein